MVKRVLVSVAALSVAAGSAVCGDCVLYVDDDAPGGGDGSSWATAFGHVQDALAAADLIGGGEIRVAQGTTSRIGQPMHPRGRGIGWRPSSSATG